MILNPISKSTKGLTPEIIITAPSGSTLDIMQNSVVLQTYTLGSSETSHTFAVKSVGSYVVRGTSGSQTKSETVSVDSVGQYEVTITFKLYLYNYGDECESVTGGYAEGTYQSSSRKLTFNSDNMTIYTPNNYAFYVSSNNKISLNGYTKLCVDCAYAKLNESASYYMHISPADTKSSTSTWSEYSVYYRSSFSRQVITISNSSTASRYIQLYNNTGTLTIYRMWLE